MSASMKPAIPPEHRLLPDYVAAAGTFTPDERIDGLNHTARLRGQLVSRTHINRMMQTFIDTLRDKTLNRQRKNVRVLELLFYLAGITKDRHILNFADLTVSEQQRFTEAMNQLKVVVSLFPAELALPQNK